MRILLIVIILFGSIKGYTQNVWYNLPTDTLGFNAFFPEKPIHVNQKLETELGDLLQETFYISRDEGPVYVYQINFLEYPEGTIHSDSTDLLDEFYQETIWAAMEQFQGVLVYDNEISLKGFPGRLYRIDYNDEKLTLKVHCFVVRNRYYSVQVIHNKGVKSNAVERFFNAFDIVPIKL